MFFAFCGIAGSLRAKHCVWAEEPPASRLKKFTAVKIADKARIAYSD